MFGHKTKLPGEIGAKLAEMAVCTMTNYILDGQSSYFDAVEIAKFGWKVCRHFQGLDIYYGMLKIMTAHVYLLAGFNAGAGDLAL